MLEAEAAVQRPFRTSNYLKAPPKSGQWSRAIAKQPVTPLQNSTSMHHAEYTDQRREGYSLGL